MRCTVTAQHLYFPYVPGKLLQLFVELGLFHRSDPLFLEKAFAFFSLPSRLLASAGLWCFYCLLRRRVPIFESLLGTAFLSTTFGYWFWPLQSNAVGFLVPMTVIALYATVRAFDQETPVAFVLSSTAISFCFLTHISAAYWVGTVGLAVVAIGLHRLREGKKRYAVSLGIFVLTALVWVTLYYVCLKHQYGSHSLPEYAAILSDANTLGGFSVKDFVRLLLKSVFGLNAALLFGFVTQSSHTFFEKTVILMQLGAGLFLLISLLSSRKELKALFTDTGVLVAMAGFTGCMLGFAVRPTWFQYCSVVAGTTAFLFVFFVLAAKTFGGKRWYVPAFAVLIIGGFYTNGMSSTRVFTERHLSDHIVYRTYSAVRELTHGEPAVLVAARNCYPYNFDGITHYYEAPGGVAEKTLWLENPSQKDALEAFQNARHILIDESSSAPTIPWVPKGFVRQSAIALPDFPRMGWWIKEHKS